MLTVSSSPEEYLTAMGIDVWLLRPRDGSNTTDDAKTDWLSLQQQVQRCQACALHQTRNHAVFGVGDVKADYLLIGEAPGMDEDRLGEPFVGQAGQLLNEILFALGLKREHVYIANVLKCRPPNNRTPLPDEIQCCSPFLNQQIQWIKPKILIALGAVAAQFLLQTEAKIGSLRGQPHVYQNIPLIVTYHPAYLLRRPIEKAKVWHDLQPLYQRICAHTHAPLQ